MPSSKCQQLSLILGELYNDIRVIAPMSPENTKMLLKQLSDYAKRIDSMIEVSEKACYDKGYSDAKTLPVETVQGKVQDANNSI